MRSPLDSAEFPFPDCDDSGAEPVLVAEDPEAEPEFEAAQRSTSVKDLRARRQRTDARAALGYETLDVRRAEATCTGRALRDVGGVNG